MQQGRAKPHPGKLARVPAQPLEALVLERVGRWAGLAEPGWTDIKTVLRRVEVHAEAVHLWIAPVRLPNASRDLELATTRLTSRLQAGETLGQSRQQRDQVRISVATCIKRRGGRTRIITPDGQPLAQRRRCDQALVRGLRSAHMLVRGLHAEPNATVDELLFMTAADGAYQRKLVSLAYLAPDIQDAILQGRQPLDLSMERLMAMDLPLAWIDQRRALGFAEAR